MVGQLQDWVRIPRAAFWGGLTAIGRGLGPRVRQISPARRAHSLRLSAASLGREVLTKKSAAEHGSSLGSRHRTRLTVLSTPMAAIPT